MVVRFLFCQNFWRSIFLCVIDIYVLKCNWSKLFTRETIIYNACFFFNWDSVRKSEIWEIQESPDFTAVPIFSSNTMKLSLHETVDRQKKNNLFILMINSRLTMKLMLCFFLLSSSFFNSVYNHILIIYLIIMFFFVIKRRQSWWKIIPKSLEYRTQRPFNLTIFKFSQQAPSASTST